MAFIPQNDIDEIIARNSIEDVVGDYVRLDRKGGQNLFGLCPFHGEKTPSFSVNTGKQFFYCFGCHAGGNVIKFIQLIENLSFPDAVAFLAKRVGIELDLEDEPEARKKQAEYKLMQACLLDAARFFYHSFKSPRGEAAAHYMQKQRRLSPGILTSFGIGYAVDSWDALSSSLLKTYDEKILLDLGLARRSGKGSIYDFFRDRVMFPVFDHLGRLRAFGGRIMGAGEAKYINSPDSRIYNKGKYLYALNFARKDKRDFLILTEGYMDTIALHEAGFTNTVAGLGTALTSSQARLIAQYTKQVILAYDADEAGRNAALKALDLLKREEIDCRVLIMPQGQDPDEYIHAKGKDRFQGLLQAALPALDYRLYLAKQKASTPMGSLDILAYQDEVTGLLAQEASPVVRELYADKLAREIAVSPASILQVIEKKRVKEASPTPAASSSRPAESIVATAQIQFDQASLTYLNALIEDNSLLEQAGLQALAEDFPQGLQPLMTKVLARARAGQLTMPDFLSLVDEEAGGADLSRRILPYFSRLSQSKLRERAEYAQEALRLLRVDRLDEARVRAIQEIDQAQDLPARQSALSKLNELNLKLSNLRNEVQDE
ncbi:MAG: DNA primase [Eubacteriales bacterium]|nr:DNA primase [Eubacteriales bacterium]